MNWMGWRAWCGGELGVDYVKCCIPVIYQAHSTCKEPATIGRCNFMVVMSAIMEDNFIYICGCHSIEEGFMAIRKKRPIACISVYVISLYT